MIALMETYKWKHAVMLTSTDPFWYKSGAEIKRQLEDAGIRTKTPTAFDTGQENFIHSLHYIKRSGIRIILFLSYDTDLNRILSQAVPEQMVKNYAWILVEEPLNPTEQMQGFLFLRPLQPTQGMQAFAQQVSDYSNSSFNITLAPDAVDLTYSTALYDAIMLYAHAANKVLEDGKDLHDGEVVTAVIRNLTIVGVGKRTVSLNSDGDRFESYEVMSYLLGAGSRMKTLQVGVYDMTNKKYTKTQQDVLWPGNTRIEPVGRITGEIVDTTLYGKGSHSEKMLG